MRPATVFSLAGKRCGTNFLTAVRSQIAKAARRSSTDWLRITAKRELYDIYSRQKGPFWLRFAHKRARARSSRELILFWGCFWGCIFSRSIRTPACRPPTRPRAARPSPALAARHGTPLRPPAAELTLAAHLARSLSAFPPEPFGAPVAATSPLTPYAPPPSPMTP